MLKSFIDQEVARVVNVLPKMRDSDYGIFYSYPMKNFIA
jgi:hypothetical protein